MLYTKNNGYCLCVDQSQFFIRGWVIGAGGTIIAGNIVASFVTG